MAKASGQAASQGRCFGHAREILSLGWPGNTLRIPPRGAGVWAIPAEAAATSTRIPDEIERWSAELNTHSPFPFFLKSQKSEIPSGNTERFADEVRFVFIPLS